METTASIINSRLSAAAEREAIGELEGGFQVSISESDQELTALIGGRLTAVSVAA